MRTALFGLLAVLALAGCEQQGGAPDAGDDMGQQMEQDGAADGGAAAGAESVDETADAGGDASAPAGEGGTCYDTPGCADGQQMSFGVSQEACATLGGASWSSGGECTDL